MSDWIEHDGTCCPVPVGTWVEGRFASGKTEKWAVNDRAHLPIDNDGRFSSWIWAFRSLESDDIIAYRLPRSRAAEDLIERIRNLEPEKEPA